MPRAQLLFGALVLAQAAHSVEEYIGRLWDVFPPARLLTGLVSPDREFGFLVINVGLILFGLWCYVWPVRRRWPAAAPLMWGWTVVEIANGVVHPVWSLMRGGYEPGTLTAPALLLLGVLLARELRRGAAARCPLPHTLTFL